MNFNSIGDPDFCRAVNGRGQHCSLLRMIVHGADNVVVCLHGVKQIALRSIGRQPRATQGHDGCFTSSKSQKKTLPSSDPDITCASLLLKQQSIMYSVFLCPEYLPALIKRPRFPASKQSYSLSSWPLSLSNSRILLSILPARMQFWSFENRHDTTGSSHGSTSAD